MMYFYSNSFIFFSPKQVKKAVQSPLQKKSNDENVRPTPSRFVMSPMAKSKIPASARTPTRSSPRHKLINTPLRRSPRKLHLSNSPMRALNDVSNVTNSTNENTEEEAEELPDFDELFSTMTEEDKKLMKILKDNSTPEKVIIVIILYQKILTLKFYVSC